jgi:hypothetical protein
MDQAADRPAELDSALAAASGYLVLSERDVLGRVVAVRPGCGIEIAHGRWSARWWRRFVAIEAVVAVKARERVVLVELDRSARDIRPADTAAGELQIDARTEAAG